MCLKVIHQFDTLMQKCILLHFENTIKPHSVGPYAVQNSEFFSIDEQVLSSNMQEKAPPQVCKLFPFLIKFLGSRVREYARPNYLLRPCVCLLVCCSQAEFSKLTQDHPKGEIVHLSNSAKTISLSFKIFVYISQNLSGINFIFPFLSNLQVIRTKLPFLSRDPDNYMHAIIIG